MGSAYIFRYDGNNWVQETKLIPWDMWSGQTFGWSVSLWQNWCLIGAPHIYFGPGGPAAYMFKYDGSNWIAHSKLLPTDHYLGAGFGWSVSMRDNRCIVGDVYDFTRGEECGAAYVFYLNNDVWLLETKLLPSLPSADGGLFGQAVSIYGNLCVVGAPKQRTLVYQEGMAYLFQFDNNTWTEAAKITSSDLEEGDRFGDSVSLWENRCLIGASYEDGVSYGSNIGAAYIFEMYECPNYDFDGDCCVNFRDYSTFTGEWGTFNWNDLAAFTEKWLLCGMPFESG